MAEARSTTRGLPIKLYVMLTLLLAACIRKFITSMTFVITGVVILGHHGLSGGMTRKSIKHT